MNILESLFSAEFIRAFAWALLHSVWQGGLIALLAFVFMHMLRKHQPGIRYSILYVLFLLLPAFFVVTFMWTYNKGISGETGIIAATGNPSLSDYNLNHELKAPSVNGSSAAWYVQPVRFFEHQAQWLVMIWLTGFLFFLARFSGSVWYVYRLKNYHVYPPDDSWKLKLRQLSDKIGLHRSVDLCESALTRIPVTVGYLKPVILLPIGTLSGISPQQIDAILLHELAHILRKDYLLNIIQSVIEILFFYHPVTWWLSARIRLEREHICDDLVIEVNHDHINYIKALTTMEEMNKKTPLLVSAITGQNKKLLSRVQRLIAPAKIRKGFGEGITAFILLVLLILTLSLNALSVIPSSYDLKGRESGERYYNLLSFNTDANSSSHVVATAALYQPLPDLPNYTHAPDTVIKKTKSGDMVIQVISDDKDEKGEKEITVIMNKPDKDCRDLGRERHDCEKDVIILKSRSDEPDSLREIVVFRSGDSIKVIEGDSAIWISDDADTSIFTKGGYYFYGIDIPDIPDIPDLPDLNYYYFHGDDLDWTERQERVFREQERAQWDQERVLREQEKALRQFEIQIRDLNDDGRLIEKELREFHMVPPDPDIPPKLQWVHGSPPFPPMKNSEKIIRQELKDDGLAFPRKQYIIEIDSKAMYINGVKQPKETFRKYKRLVESLEEVNFDTGGSYRLIF